MAHPTHPYTQGLIAAIPNLRKKLMSEILLQTKALTKHYFTPNHEQINTCRSISLTLYKGETLGIVGESGCGKSSLLKMIANLEKPTSGELYFKSQNITGLKGKVLREHLRHIQMVFQDPTSAFYNKMTVGDALRQAIKNYEKHKKAVLDAKVEALLRLAQLPESFATRYPHELSGGQRQRLGIARACTYPLYFSPHHGDVFRAYCGNPTC